jgi:L,D-peptidoglycan transpeptidase YkuD (ErfK/YbiS/YcfS/YnhG family)
VIAFNTSPVVPGRGSGIFLHVSTGRPTLGCVSLPLSQLVATLHWLRPSAAPRIAIGTTADLLR